MASTEQQVAGIAAAGELYHLALAVLDHDRRLEVLATLIALAIDDHPVGDAGRFVGLLSFTDTPSTTSSNSTMPSTSVMIGRV